MICCSSWISTQKRTPSGVAAPDGVFLFVLTVLAYQAVKPLAQIIGYYLCYATATTAASEQRLPPRRGKMSPQVTKGGIWYRVAMTERGLPLQKRNTGTPAGVPVLRSLNKENQIRLRASSSATRMKSGCSCRMLAGTSGVTGPKKAFLTISALPAPLTTISTLRACMMVRMPMV